MSDASKIAPATAPRADGGVRRLGRAWISTVYAAIRNLKLYPVENAVVRKGLDDLTRISGELLDADGECDFRAAGEFLFLNGVRMKLDLDNFTSFSFLLARCRDAGIGGLRFTQPPSVRDWTIVLSFLLRPDGDTPEDRYERLGQRLRETGVEGIEIAPPSASADAPLDPAEVKERARRTYQHSVSATKDVMQSLRMGQNPSVRRIKRVVQNIVDQILADEVTLVGLTTIRDYDDYTFTHSVNVTIFSIALGRRLGLTRSQLFDLGYTALFHDIGKSRIPIEIIQKPEPLTEDEWRLVMAHPWLGVLALFQVKDHQEFPYRSMLVSYQHHMKRDLTGYPRALRTAEMTFFSKIVAVADSFDAATSRRVYKAVPLSPAAVLEEMRDSARRGMDSVIVKAFVALLGAYPVGSLVGLDSGELALVHAANPIPEMLARPIVRIIADADGVMEYPGTLFDLATQDSAGHFVKSINRIVDAERYGIRVGDYFL